jgi:hypothetical protein
MYMTYREPPPGDAHRVHALRPTRGTYQTWCGLAGPEVATNLDVDDEDRPCPDCLNALRAEVRRNQQVLSTA